MSKPTEGHLQRLKHLARYLAGTKDLGTWMPQPKTSGNHVELKCWSDANWASKETGRKSVSCGVIAADGCVLRTFAARQGVISTSSAESEFYAMSCVALEAPLFREVLSFAGFEVWATMGVDSEAAKAVAAREGCGRIRHLDVRSLWLQQEVKEKRLVIKKVDGTKNPADIGTKAHSKGRMEELKLMCSVKSMAELRPPSFARQRFQWDSKEEVNEITFSASE